MLTSGPHSLLSQTEVFGLQGTGGCARGIMPLIAGNRCTRSGDKPNRLLVFIEPNPQVTSVNGYPVLSESDFLALECHRKYFNVGVASSSAREAIYHRYKERGIEPFAIHASNAIVFDYADIAEGAILSPFTTITANTKIGKMFHLNINSYVEHDCVIGDFVTFAPGVQCNGNIHIEDHAYIGAGAVIRQGTSDKPLTIGRGALVGMGAVVTKDVPAFSTVIGNPARVAPS